MPEIHGILASQTLKPYVIFTAFWVLTNISDQWFPTEGL